MRIVGTAGHVDHGKSSLVAALTGTDPDRWAQEQLRGMTIDLGFAELRFDDGQVAGIVDVPGHERFLHNMLAGASGMDVLLLCVDAKEGAMPQTREHLDILAYLNARAAIVAVTKADLLDEAALQAAMARIAGELRGTIAEGAPFVAVSSVTGSGLAELRAQLARALHALPPRDAQAPVYLPIDRAFALEGVGTVVTGTLMQGTIRTGDSLIVQPDGLRARARSVQVFGKSVERAEAGARVAINLAGVARAGVSRGDVVAGGEFVPQRTFVVRFLPLRAALSALRRRTPVRAYVGAAEILGTLVFEAVPERAEEVRAELHLREATIGFPGVRFVVRRPSPKMLLGGGYIEGVDAAHAPLEGRDPIEEAALAVLRERGFDPPAAADVAARINAREEVARAALAALVERGEAVELSRPAAYLDAEPARAVLARAIEYLESAQRNEPWAMGCTSLALARVLELPETLLLRLLSVFAAEGRLAHRAGYYATPEFQPQITEGQRELFDAVVTVDAVQPLLPVPYATLAAAVKASPAPGARKALDTLLATGALVKVGDDVYRGAQIAMVRARVESFCQEHATMTAAQFRDLIGTSRKYAVPLLEWLDARGVTVRSGDLRSLRKGPA